MRFVPIKQREQQAGLVLHPTRHLLIRQLTAVTNTIRAHLAEFGIVAPVGRRGVQRDQDPERSADKQAKDRRCKSFTG